MREPDYNIIYDFCKVKNLGNTYKNTQEPTPRVQFLLDLCKNLGIEAELDIVYDKIIYIQNIYLKGSSDKAIMAHHDIININSDNALDNSASCINTIIAKYNNPSLNVFINDGEEIGGEGAYITAQKIKENYFGNISWVFNLELTGVGGENFFVESSFPNSVLFKKIKELYPNCDNMNRLPFHDGVILRKFGIDSIVVTTLPKLEDDKLDYRFLHVCHQISDSVDLLNINDMKLFTEKVIQQIIEL